MFSRQIRISIQQCYVSRKVNPKNKVSRKEKSTVQITSKVNPKMSRKDKSVVRITSKWIWTTYFFFRVNFSDYLIGVSISLTTPGYLTSRFSIWVGCQSVRVFVFFLNPFSLIHQHATWCHLLQSTSSSSRVSGTEKAAGSPNFDSHHTTIIENKRPTYYCSKRLKMWDELRNFCLTRVVFHGAD